MGKCGMQWDVGGELDAGLSSEPMTKCGNYVCSDECYKTWAFCPHCGKPFDYEEKPDDDCMV